MYETAESIVTTIGRRLAPAVLGPPGRHLDAVGRAFERAIGRGSPTAPPRHGAARRRAHPLPPSRRLARDRGPSEGIGADRPGSAASPHPFSAYGIATPVEPNGRRSIESPSTGPTVRVEHAMAETPPSPGLGVAADEATVRGLARDVLERAK
ncbi:hypothetical protein ACFVIM_03265 [Streptomyces sp. NPDC057638]|uniref:hypothetical protein n=1 Tax=Streptomyces sp. NPDC057638 TaxID=3346190 RepID=UPI0036CB5C3C